MDVFLSQKYKTTLRTNSLGIIKHTRYLDDLKLSESAINDVNDILGFSRE